MNNLPAKLEVTNGTIEKHLQISIDCLAHVHGYGINKAIYLHSLEAWIVDGVTGHPPIIEWWPLPEIGTGNKVEGDSDE